MVAADPAELFASLGKLSRNVQILFGAYDANPNCADPSRVEKAVAGLPSSRSGAR